MSESGGEAAAPEAPPEAEPKAKDQESPQTFDAEYVKKLRAEAAKYRTENKALSEKAKQWDDHSEAQKSELDKALEKAAQAEKELEALRNQSTRMKVASKFNLPAALSDRLKGSTEEEMEEDARAMLAELEERYVAKSGPSRSETGAGVGGGKVNYESMSPKELVEMVREKRGR